ncbi:MAG: hypothetical protein GY953_51145, partial [bacterium]|nr:hypothetical protein [bacterium]
MTQVRLVSSRRQRFDDDETLGVSRNVVSLLREAEHEARMREEPSGEPAEKRGV